ncbi:hypothetical protein ACRFB9_28030 [Klebsiella pneumoniae]
MKFLEKWNVGGIIGRVKGKGVGEMSDDEVRLLYKSFEIFGGCELVGRWVKEMVWVDYRDMMKIVWKSIEKMECDREEGKEIVRVGNLEYNGSRGGDGFERKVRKIMERVKNNGIDMNKKVGWELIMRGVCGEYKFLG